MNDQQVILCTGELLVDMISTEFADDILEVETFRRLQGGSPANLANNLALLGKPTVLVASLGQDDLGRFIYHQLQNTPLNIHYVQRRSSPTTLILVTRSKSVSNFEAYRGADADIRPEQFPDELLQSCRIFHTTCFGLSRQPARDSILAAATKVSQLGGQISIDVNYAEKIWPDRNEAQQVIADYCALGALVKVSEVDWERIYQYPVGDHQEVADHFLKLGAREVCLTLGDQGVFTANSEESRFLAARTIEVKDTTGAGDAFWSGYLAAWSDEKTLAERLLAGRRMAEIKLMHFGPLRDPVSVEELYQDL